MGKLKKGYNWKARQQSHTSAPSNNSKKDNIKLEFEHDETKYDSCNALVLPDKKEKQKKEKIVEKKQPTILSNKKKKKLEKILKKKKEKTDRAQLLDNLMKCQIDSKEHQLLASTCQIQTKGRKRLHQETIQKINEETIPLDKIEIKKTRKNKNKADILEKTFDNDPNIIGFNNEQENRESESESESENDYVKTEIDESLSVETETVKTIVEDKDKVEKQELVKENNDNQVQNDNVETKNLVEAKNTNRKQPNTDKKQPNTDKKQPKSKDRTKSDFNENEKSVYVFVNRTDEIEKIRSMLPIINEEQAIMEAIKYNPVIILCGETGSGKTTQVPQFLYESGFANQGKIIGITQPRRVAATAMSERVASEMNLTHAEVSYQIRFEGNVTGDTKIKFMTDGVLLKEIQNDFMLTKYSAIVIDEAHERSIFSDILIGLLSRIVPLRLKKGNPLKCIIMSATLRVEDFTSNTKLFKSTPPVLKIDSRQYPVTIHFNKKTPDDYLQEAFKKVCKIHTECPPGGILVFLTGQQEVNSLCKKLRIKFSKKVLKNQNIIKNKFKSKDNKNQGHKPNNENKTFNDLLPKINLEDYSLEPIQEEELLEKDKHSDEELSDLELLSDDDDDDDGKHNFLQEKVDYQPLYCLPLYSMLPKNKQELVFKDPPPGSRLCVVATNVAETSLTIPGIKYVVDSGKVKMRVYDNVTGISAFLIKWASKASADQRAGRAGRIGPGHCYRLYSSSIYNDEFPKYSEPEILRKPVDDLLLQMKAMNIENVVNFPFPSQPSIEALFAAEKRLVQMGALKDISRNLRYKAFLKEQWRSPITPLGKAMACFPICPRYAKMLVLSRQHNLLAYVIAIVAALTIKEIFTEQFDETLYDEDDEKKKQFFQEKRQKSILIKKQWIGNEQSLLLGDVMTLLNAVGASEFAGCTPKFCEKNYLRHKAMVEIRKLRLQLTNEVNSVLQGINLSVSPDMKPPTEIQAKLIRQIILCGFFDHIARKVPDSEINENDKKKMKNAYKSIEVEEYVFISPNSILTDHFPEYVIYQEIFETSKLYMRIVSAIEPEWLPIYVPNLCNFSDPLDDPAPRYDAETDTIKCHRSSYFGPHAWSIPPVQVEYPEGIDKIKLFAKFLLEGQVITSLKKYSKMLLSPPAIILKSWATLQPRIESLLKALINENIQSKKSLANKWMTDKNYLLNEYLAWLPDLYHEKTKSNWPPKL